MHILKFLESLSQLGNIDFSDKKEEFYLFAQKYDKNKNSVFEKEELEELIGDLIKFAGQDDKNVLDNDEGESFYKYLLQNNEESGTQTLEYSKEDINQYLKDLITNLTNLGKEPLINTFDRIQEFDEYDRESLLRLSPEELNKAKNLLHVKNRERDFSCGEIVELAQLSDEELECAKALFSVKNRKKQFNGYEIAELAKLSVEEFERAKTLFSVKNRKEQFSGYEIVKLAKLSDEELKRAEKYLFDIKNREKQFEGDEIARLGKLSDEELELAKEHLFNVEGREIQFNVFDIECLVKLSEDELQRAKKFLFYAQNNKELLYGDSIADLAKLNENELKRVSGLFFKFGTQYIKEAAKLSDEEFERAKILFDNDRVNNNIYDIIVLVKTLSKEQFKRVESLLNVENREEQFDTYDICSLAELSDEEFERAKTLFNVESRKNQFCGLDIAALAKLSDEKLKYAQEHLFKIESRVKQFSGVDIAELMKLSPEEYKRAEALFYIKDRLFLQFGGRDIIELLKLSDKEYTIAESLFDIKNRDYPLDSSEIVCITKCYCKEIKDILTNNPNCNIIYKNQNCRIYLDENSYYSCDKNGRFEYVTEETSPVIKRTIINKKLGIKQEVLYNNNEGEEDIINYFTDGTDIDAHRDKFKVEHISEEKITYYDDNNNVIKTVLKKIDKDGNLNVSETDSKGNTIPIQWTSSEPMTEAKITEQHLTSPNGDKTEYFREESENLKVTDYKITDKDGNVLINLHQTFEKVSDNKYISSVNTTGNKNDTQIYEITYTDDYKIEILDKKNQHTTIINLKEYIKDGNSMHKLMPVLKQLPGQILLEISKKQIFLEYDWQFHGNGHWNSTNKTIVIENWENSVDEKNTLLYVMTHELGHYIDNISITGNTDFSANQELMNIYKEELKVLKETTTAQQENYIDYFTDLTEETRAAEERFAETHAIMYANNCPRLNMRKFYFAQYFPRTMAKIMEILLKEEGVNLSS